MTDIAAHTSARTARATSVSNLPQAAQRARALAGRFGWRGLFVALFLAGTGAGIALGMASHPTVVPDAGLIPLLRFMAVLKGGLALGAAGLASWRVGRPIGSGRAIGYAVGIAAMAFAPGLIWTLANGAVAAVAFHAGLILFALIALGDDDAIPALRGRRAPGKRANTD